MNGDHDDAARREARPPVAGADFAREGECPREPQFAGTAPVLGGEGERPREPGFAEPHLPLEERPREPSSSSALSLPLSLPQRHKPASGVLLARLGPTIVFLTVCTEKRQPWLAQPQAQALLREVWREAAAWSVGFYLLMPDHLHLFCAPHDPVMPLNRWVSYWKRRFTQRAGHPEWVWQAHHWDTRLRRNEHYGDKWRYVAANPVRKGLVTRAEDWPYQGVLNELRW